MLLQSVSLSVCVCLYVCVSVCPPSVVQCVIHDKWYIMILYHEVSIYYILCIGRPT